jgi:hypothetical protein
MQDFAKETFSIMWTPCQGGRGGTDIFQFQRFSFLFCLLLLLIVFLLLLLLFLLVVPLLPPLFPLEVKVSVSELRIMHADLTEG